jgi:hypothetical protein
MSITTNVDPVKFGKGATIKRDWKCFCGEVNRRYLLQCGMCGVHRTYSEDKDDQ